ncbi:MAG TPA: phage tail protein [Caldilineaceae bacterium]|nr:phage tail protein [Caldilineaceae bacterium]HRW06059.1 phage tail protein [Caldilineaceae bacterium]
MAEDNGTNTPTAQLLYETHTAFRYKIEIADITVGAFTECTLPAIELETEEVKEGGLNTHTHFLPGRRKAARLILKNGVGKNQLVDWCIETLQTKISGKSSQIKTQNITITLQDARGSEPICAWHIERAYPVKWVGPTLKADTNAIAIQTIEFVCGLVEMSIGKGVTD